MKSPFKFLDAFELRDRDVFFGRDEETEQLYQMVNKNRLVLVYGQSGIGKTSLIQCGLAGRYDSTDWLPIFVRRGDDFNQSFSSAIKKILPDVIIPGIIGPDEIEAAFNKFLRPIYLIFDQLEELFILGSIEEQKEFIESICALHENDLPCRILFVIREEYLGALYDFEKTIPTLFDRRLRVEPMNASKVTDVLQQSFSRFNIQLVSPSHNIKQIIENVSDKRAGVSLSYLQIYLDQLWLNNIEHTYSGHVPANEEFPALLIQTAEIDAFGDISEVLGRFLPQQRAILQSNLKARFPLCLGNEFQLILDAFVTEEGTRKSLKIKQDDQSGLLIDWPEEALGSMPPLVQGFCLDLLEKSRLLRINNNNAELAHDSLAALIDRERSDEQRQINEVKKRLKNAMLEREKGGDIPGRKLLLDVEEFLPKMRLDAAQVVFFESSLAELKKRENAERIAAQLRARKSMQWALVLLAVSLGMLGFAFWAVKQRNLASLKEKEAAANSLLAKAQATPDRTTAFRLLEMAYRIDSNNQEVKQELFDNVYFQGGYTDDDLPISAKFPISILNQEFLTEYLADAFYSNFPTEVNRKGLFNEKLFNELFAINDLYISDKSTFAALVLSTHNAVLVWDFKKQKEAYRVNNLKDSIAHVSISPNGRFLSIVGKNSVTIWDHEKNEIVPESSEFKLKYKKSVFSPDGKTIAYLSMDDSIILYDLNKKDVYLKISDVFVKRRLEDIFLENGLSEPPPGLFDPYIKKEDWVSDLKFSNNGKMLIVSSTLIKAVVVLDISKNALKATVSFSNFITSTSISSDDKTLIASALDGKLYLIDIDKKSIKLELQVCRGHASCKVLAADFITPDQLLVCTSTEIIVYDIKEKIPVRNIQKLDKRTNQAVILKNKAMDVLTLSDNGILSLWKLSSLTRETYKPKPTLVTDYYASFFSPEHASRLFINNGALTMESMGMQSFFGKDRFDLEGVSSIQPSFTGVLLLRKGIVDLMDFSNSPSKRFQLENDSIQCMSVSYDYQKVVFGSNKKKVSIWDITKGKKEFELNNLSESVEFVKIAPKNDKILIGFINGRAEVWGIKSASLLYVLGEGYPNFTNMDFSPDGSKISTTSAFEDTQVWEANTGQLLFQIKHLVIPFTYAYFDVLKPGQLCTIRENELNYYWLSIDSLLNYATDKYKIGELQSFEISMYSLESYLIHANILDKKGSPSPLIKEGNEQKMFSYAEYFIQKGSQEQKQNIKEAYYKKARNLLTALSKLAKIRSKEVYLEKLKSIENKKG